MMLYKTCNNRMPMTCKFVVTVKLLVILSLTATRIYGIDADNEAGYRNTVIGVYSICQDDSESSVYSKMGEINRNVIKSIFDDVQNKSYLKLYYQDFNVCNSTELLVKATMDLVLDESFYLNNTNGLLESKIMVIFVYLTDQLWELFDALVSMVDIPIQRMNSASYLHPKNEKTYYSKFVIKYYSDLKVKIFEYITRMMSWNYVTVVLLNPNPLHIVQIDRFRRLYLNNSNKTNRCLTIEQVFAVAAGNQSATYERLIRRMSRNSNIQVVFLVGLQKEQKEFLNAVTTELQRQPIWVLLQYLDPHFGMNINAIVINGLEEELFYYGMKKVYKFDEFYKRVLGKIGTIEMQLQAFVSYYYTLKTYLVLTKAHNVYEPEMFKNLTQMESFIFVEYHFQFNGHQIRDSFIEKYTIPTKFNKFSNVSCPSDTLVCKPGTEKKFGVLSRTETEWQEEHGWTCVKCTPNYYKSFDGDGACEPCQAPNIVNQQHSLCYDAYEDNYLKVDNLHVQISLAVAAVGLVLTLAVFIIVLVYFRTPVIRATDLKLTILHLMVSAVLLVVSMVVYIGCPSREKCTLRFVVPILYSVTVSIVFVKSQKILAVFNSHTKLKKSEVMRTEAVQVFMMVLLTLVAVVIAVVCSVKQKPERLEMLNESSMERIVYCNNSNDMNALITYIMCVQIACLVQAFRARNLPDVYNTAMSIVYATFVTTVFFGAMFPIYYYQENELDRSVVHWVTLVGNNAVLILLFYEKPLLIALFQPKHNRRSYVQKNIRANMQ